MKDVFELQTCSKTRSEDVAESGRPCHSYYAFTTFEALQIYIQVVRVPAYISTIISAAADEGPDKMMCFPAGLHYLLTFPTRMSKITQKSMCFYANFSEKGCLHIAIYANFSKRENVWIV